MTAFEPAAVVAAVRSALKPHRRAILHGHLSMGGKWPMAAAGRVGTRLQKYGTEALMVTEFEEAVRQVVGVKHAVATSSGTAALHLALLVAGVKPGDLVACPALTFVASAAAIRYCDALPLFYDQFWSDLPETAATIGVDLLGIPEPQRQTGMVIEDAAQALGSRHHDGSMAGAGARIGILSFNLNKIVTSGGGGMLLTNDEGVAVEARFLASTAKLPIPFYYHHAKVGFNYRMAIPAAIYGLANLANLDAVLDAKRAVHMRYREAFREVGDVTLVQAPEGVTWNHWLNAIEVPDGCRDITMQALTDAGYECRALFTPLHLLPPYARFAPRTSFEEAEWRFQHTVCLPSGPELA